MNGRWSIYVAAIAVQVLLALGQVLFKVVARRAYESGWAVLQNGAAFVHVAIPTVAAGLLYAGVAGLWLYVLQHMPLNRAFLFVSLTFVFVPLTAHFLVNETISTGTIVGTGLIISGIAIGVFL
jgi:drug/metabolite transporter (DMT)-like permease